SRTWDLDFVVEEDEWLLLQAPPDSVREIVDELGRRESGTAVIWSSLDHLVGDAAVEDRAAEDAFYAVADRIRDHLAMVFGESLRGRGAITIQVSGHPVQPWDPFLGAHDATQILPVEPLHWRGTEICVTPYVLPHHSRMTAAEWERAGGTHGWNAHQGFYI